MRNICLLIVGVQHSASHERDLEWLLDNPNNSSVSFVLMLPHIPMSLQLHDNRPKGIPDIFIVPVFRRKLRNDSGWLLGVARRAAIDVLGDV